MVIGHVQPNGPTPDECDGAGQQSGPWFAGDAGGRDRGAQVRSLAGLSCIWLVSIPVRCNRIPGVEKV